MIERIISGGQTGADQAGWRAAKAAGIPTGGWMPRGYRTEDGPRPEFAELYRAVQYASTSAYPPRTRANIADSEATIIFSVDEKSRGTVLAYETAYLYNKPCAVVKVNPADLNPAKIEMVRPIATAEWLRKNGVKTLNIAGNRESGAPGIGEFVERYMGHVFRLLEASEESAS